jgi:LPS export ABC transporter protein LptC
VVSQTKSSVIIAILICVLIVSCSKGKSILPMVSLLDQKEMPMMHTEDAISLISDSGMTRFRIKADIWDVFSEKGSTQWYFPKGFYLERFDSLFNVEANVIGDTAYYYEKQGLWKLVGNVKIVNMKQEKFETSELFWDQKKQKVYSDSLVRVEQEGSIITVIGFESNQEMTQYRFYKVQPSVFYINEKVQPDSTITVNTDSLND